MHTPTTSPSAIFSVYRKGPRPPISTITYFVHYSAWNNRGKDFLWFVWALKEAGASAPGPSLAPPAPFWLHWPQRQLLPLVSDLLASPLPPPPTGERGLDTLARTPAWPRTGLHSPTPDPLAVVEAGKSLPSTAPHTGLWPSLRQFRLMSPFSGNQSMLYTDVWDRQPPAAHLAEVSRSSFLPNVIRSFSSC